MLAGCGKVEIALFDPDVQALSPERLRDLRAAGVARLLAKVRAAANVRQRAAAPSGLGSFPLLGGVEFAEEVEQHPPFGRFALSSDTLIRAGLATAAVPRPVPIAWSRADLDREAALGARAFARAGLGPRSRTSDTLDGGLVSPGTLAVTDALDALDALALPVGPIVAEAALGRAREVWEIVRPQALIVDASSFSFLEAHGETGRGRSTVVLLTPDDAARLAVPATPETLRVLSVPQVCTFAAGECSVRAGYHLAEDAVAAEIVDPSSSEPVRDGEAGRLVITALDRGLALIRFDTGLRGRLDRDPCACGETHARVIFYHGEGKRG
jgi:phenylacetate-CoA ligase